MSHNKEDISGLAHLPRLGDDSDYQTWSKSILINIRSRNLSKYMLGLVPRPTIPSPADPAAPTAADSKKISAALLEADDWDVQDAKILDTLQRTTEDGPRQIVHESATSAAAWARLSETYSVRGFTTLYNNITSLVTSKYVDGQSVKAHLANMESLALQCRDSGFPIPDKALCVFMLRSMPASWDAITTVMETLESTSASMDIATVRARLGTIAARRADRQAPSPATGGALAARMNVDPSAAKSVCAYCRKDNHAVEDCRKLARKRSKTGTAASAQSDASAVNHLFAVASPLLPLPQQKWILDTGAHQHFTGDKSSLINFVDAPYDVIIANGEVVTCPGHGSLVIQSMKAGHTLTITNVYFLPGARTGLISPGQLHRAGATVTLSNDVYEISSHGILLARAAGPHYYIDTSPALVATTRDASSASLMAWHRRLGHISPRAVLDMANHGLVEGLKLSDRKILDCEPCLYAKSKRTPFTHTARPSTEVLHRVFIDLGFIPDPDRHGNRVYLIIVDHFSCAKWAFPLKSKSSSLVTDVFVSWRTHTEKFTGKSLKIVRSDNGGEFMSLEFQKYLRESGIHHEPTAPYTPEQNGKVERLNGSVMPLVRSLLKDAELDTSFWSDALAFALYSMNRMPHPSKTNTTPYEIVHRRKPDVHHMRPFGAQAFVHVDKSLRSKLDDTAVPGLLIGYSGTNYIVWLSSSHTTVTTRHASFGRQERPTLIQSKAPSPASLPPALPPQSAVSNSQYRPVTVGYNPGRLEHVNPDNIIIGSRARAPVTYAQSAQPYSCDNCVYCVTDVLDADSDDAWVPPLLVCVAIGLPHVPQHYKAAMASVECAQWRLAIESELDSIESHHVWDLVDLPPNARALGSRWVFARKEFADGSIERYKARLVAQGFSQRPGIDVNETFAPVARSTTVRFLIAYAASANLDLQQFDFETAFLNGTMTEDVYMKIPDGFRGTVPPNKVLKLAKSMYGTRQAPREWQLAVTRLMTSRGYTAAVADPCMYHKRVGGSWIIALMYVDDGIALSNDPSLVDSELLAIHAVYKLKRLGKLSYYLSLELHYSDEGIIVHQTKYIREILERFGFNNDGRGSRTPMESSPQSDDVTSPAFTDIALYQSAVGSLLYAAQQTRPDIATAVRAASRHSAAPTEADWTAVKRIFRYLSNTVDLGIAYRRNASLVLETYADADWANDTMSRKSIGGFASMLAGGLISWQSKQQSLVATSTTEAELLAASSATREVLWLRKLSQDAGVPCPLPTVIWEDNDAATAIATNPIHHERTKHYDVAQLFVRERVAMGDVTLKRCASADMIADTFTKGLAFVLFERHRAAMGMTSVQNGIGGSVRT